MTSATDPAKPAIAVSVTFTLRLKGSVSPRAPSRVRWGRIEVWMAWKSCSGARAISSTLKTKPASAAPPLLSVALTSSGPAFRKVCSESMIASTATANPVPWESVNSGSPPGSPAEASSSMRASAEAFCPATGAGAGRAHLTATGTTASDAIGAAAMPSATTDCPSASPTATTSANMTRDRASISTSAPYRPKRRWPARKPRAK